MARVGLGLMIRAGAPKPDVSTVEAFRKTLLDAKSITYVTSGASGVAFLATIEKMGIADAIKAKAKPAANGDQVNANILSGASDLAVLPVSEILPVKGAEVGGVFPSAVQTFVVMTAGVNTATRSAVAREFIAYLMLAPNSAVVRDKGMERRECDSRLVLSRRSPPPCRQAPERARERFAENPLITFSRSPSIGDNANGPTVIRVPRWVQRPLGRYYMYFAHHSGQFIRLAYADSVRGPWKIHEPGVLKVADTAFYRPQPDPADSPSGVYTHLASPEIYIDESRSESCCGSMECGPRDSGGPSAAGRGGVGEAARVRAIHAGGRVARRIDVPRPAHHQTELLARDSLRGTLLRYGQTRATAQSVESARRLRTRWQSVPRFTVRGSSASRVAARDNGLLHIVFSAIGDAPENILYTTVSMKGDWDTWRIGPVSASSCRKRVRVPRSACREIRGRGDRSSRASASRSGALPRRGQAIPVLHVLR